MRALTTKQSTFVQEYLVDLNGAQAAIRAGYSRKTAASIGEQLMRKPEIKEAIQAAMDERAARTGITAARTVEQLARLAFFDIRDILNADGSMKAIHGISPDALPAIAGLEIVELKDSDGCSVGQIKKIKLVDRLGAIDKLMRHLGQYEDKVTLKGDAENPLTLLVKAVQGNALRPVPTHALPGPEEEEQV